MSTTNYGAGYPVTAAKKKANVPRKGQRQTLTGLDPYHQYIVQESRDGPKPKPGSKQGLRTPEHRVNTPIQRHENMPDTSRPTLSKLPSSVQTLHSRATTPKSSATSQAQVVAVPSLPSTAGRPSTTGCQKKGGQGPLLPTTLQGNNDWPRAKLPWRPFYLQRRVLSLFVLIFVGLVVSVEVLLVISNRNTGLGASSGALRYVWQYSVPGIFILIATLFARANHQARSTASWLRLSKGPCNVSQSLTLDYTSCIQPWAVCRAIQNKDWLVVAVGTVDILVKTLVVVSVALVTPRLMGMEDRMAPITKTRSFVNDPARLEQPGSLAYAMMAGAQIGDIDFIDGASRDFAYQTFESDLPSSAEITTAVDGFQGSIECEEADMELDTIQLMSGITTEINVTVSSKSSTCNTNHSVINRLLSSDAPANVPRVFMVLQPGNCGGSDSPDDGRVTVLFGSFSIDSSSLPNGRATAGALLNGTLPQSGALHCRPSYGIKTVEVTKNSTNLVDLRVSDDSESRLLDNLPSWDIATAHFDSYAGSEQVNGIPQASTHYFDVAVVHSDTIMDAMLAMEARNNGIPRLPTLLQMDTLQRLSETYWQQYMAFFARDVLMEETAEDDMAVAAWVGERLMVNRVPAHLMATLLSLAAAGCAIAMWFAPKEGFLPRDPSTIMDVATLVSHSRPLLQCLQGAGAGSEHTVQSRLQGSLYSTGVEPYDKTSSSQQGFFTIFGGNPPETGMIEKSHTGDWKRPVSLHLGARVGLIIIVLGAIAGLEAVFRVSARDMGFVAVSDSDSLHILWTSGTAIVLGSLAVALGSADMAVRRLAPFSKLKTGDTLQRTVGLDFLDKAKPVVLWTSLRNQHMAVFVTALTALLSATTVIFSGALLKPTPIPVSRDVTLQPVDFFANTTALTAGDGNENLTTPEDGGTIVSSLIFHSNLTFPSFTHENLAFQSFEFAKDAPSPDKDASSVMVQATVNALRPNLSCRLYPASAINANIRSEEGLPDSLRVEVNSEACGSESMTDILMMPGQDGSPDFSGTPDARGYFGQGTTRYENTGQCSQLFYTWGRVEPNTGVSYVGAMGCNETLETVSTSVTFTGIDLQIDPMSPPRVDEGSAQGNDVALPNVQYSSLARLSNSASPLLDNFFATLTTSRYAIPVDWLGDEELRTVGAVADAIVAQHQIIRIQGIHKQLRQRPASDGSTLVSSDGEGIINGMEGTEELPQVQATLNWIGSSSAWRFEVDEVTSRILQAFFIAILGGALLGLFLAGLGVGDEGLLGPGVLPRNPGSIASTAALLADGNLFGFLPRGAEWMSLEEIDRQLGKGGLVAGFRLGWDTVKKRRRGLDADVESMPEAEKETFGIRVVRSGGWYGGEEVGLGPLARIGVKQRRFVRSWGWNRGDS